MNILVEHNIFINLFEYNYKMVTKRSKRIQKYTKVTKDIDCHVFYQFSPRRAVPLSLL